MTFCTFINYGLPNRQRTHVHRIVNTGRAGHDRITCLFCESEKIALFRMCQKLIGLQIPVAVRTKLMGDRGEEKSAGNQDEELKEKQSQ